MFSNLTQGSILYGLETNGDYKVFTAPITNTPVVKPVYKQNGYTTVTEMTVDIEAMVNGEKREFKQVPSNNSIANFGENAFVLADSKEALNTYIQSMLQNSKKVIESVDKHKELIKQFENSYKQLNPNYIDNDSTVKELRSKVDSMESRLDEIITLIKSGNNKE